MSIKTFCVLDTETTGLTRDRSARVIEVAVARFEDGQPVATFSGLVRPDVMTEEGARVALEICGIASEDIQAAPHPWEVWGSVLDVIGSHPVVAWNMPFDQQMVRRSFFEGVSFEHSKRLRQYPPNWSECAMLRFTHQFADYAERWENGDPRWFRLETAARLVEIPWEGQAHRAMADVLMTGRIYAGMLAGTLVARAGGVEHPPSRGGAWHPAGADGKPSA
jgi:DNA polymerase-3 subunit epsilon